MPTIIECITQAEAKGAELKKQAAARAKEITDDAEARRGETIMQPPDAAHALVKAAQYEAENQGGAPAADSSARPANPAEAAYAKDGVWLRAGGGRSTSK